MCPSMIKSRKNSTLWTRCSIDWSRAPRSITSLRRGLFCCRWNCSQGTKNNGKSTKFYPNWSSISRRTRTLSHVSITRVSCTWRSIFRIAPKPSRDRPDLSSRRLEYNSRLLWGGKDDPETKNLGLWLTLTLFGKLSMISPKIVQNKISIRQSNSGAWMLT